MSRSPLAALVRFRFGLLLAALWAGGWAQAGNPTGLPPEYDQVQRRLTTGWNTWNSNSVLSEVLAPQGLSVTIGFHQLALFSQEYLRLAQPTGRAANPSPVVLHSRAVDGSYTDLILNWQGLRARVETAVLDSDLYLLISPIKTPEKAPIADIEVGLLWNRPGTVQISGDDIVAALPDQEVRLFPVGTKAEDRMIQADGPYWAFSTADPIAVSSGRRRTMPEIERVIAKARGDLRKSGSWKGIDQDTVEAVRSAIGWDTVYDPIHDRAISPVSRSWDVGWGGYILFEWDTFFAGYQAGFFSRDLAYANVIEELREATAEGFVPNYSGARGIKSIDRSQPPVASLVVAALYRRFHDRWFLEATFPRLLLWNRWWNDHRQVDGYLVWGSDPTDESHRRDDPEVDSLQAAKYESGLDNSPMFDEAHYDGKSHKMRQADVGLMGLYVADCDYLAEIASWLGRTQDADELSKRAMAYRSKLNSLWDPGRGIYLNKNLDTGEFNPRLSPTNFYPLLAKAPTEEQAQRMAREHLRNPAEFWGDWVMPSTPRNDPAFKDNNYWRGRIWAPMNFLVYLGLRNYKLAEVQRDFAAKSEALLLKEWRSKGHIHENYNATTGDGDDVTSSDPFYHWGALLGSISLIEGGYAN
jgi:putative isomerase